MSNQICRIASFAMALAMLLTGAGCAQLQPSASSNGVDTNPYEQSDQRKKSQKY